MSDLTIRRFVAGDAAAAAQLFYDAVHQGTTAFYDAAQRKAWAAHVPDSKIWRDRLAAQSSFMAERAEDLAGYMTLTRDGLIDLAFVAPAHIGTGVALALYAAIETDARGQGLARITTEASHPARRFFLRQGWLDVREQTVWKNGVALTNFEMEKRLG